MPGQPARASGGAAVFGPIGRVAVLLIHPLRERMAGEVLNAALESCHSARIYFQTLVHSRRAVAAYVAAKEPNHRRAVPAAMADRTAEKIVVEPNGISVTIRIVVGEYVANFIGQTAV